MKCFYTFQIVAPQSHSFNSKQTTIQCSHLIRDSRIGISGIWITSNRKKFLQTAHFKIAFVDSLEAVIKFTIDKATVQLQNWLKKCKINYITTRSQNKFLTQKNSAILLKKYMKTSLRTTQFRFHLSNRYFESYNIEN